MKNIICTTTKSSQIKVFHCDFCKTLFSADATEWNRYIPNALTGYTSVCPKCRAVCGELGYQRKD